MALVWKSSVITQALVDLLTTSLVPATLKAVYYADQERIPDVPSVAVMSGPRSREFNQTGLQYEITITTYINVYHGLIDDLQTITKQADETAETVEATLNAARLLPDGDGNQRVIHAVVTDFSPGFASRGNALWVVHQLTHRCISRQQVGS